MSTILLHDQLQQGAIDALSPERARFLRDHLMAEHHDVFTNRRHPSHDLMSRGIAALSRQAFGEGADDPFCEGIA